MARRLFTLLSALSLLLCVAVCVLWVRSHLAMDHVQYVGRVGPRTATRFAGMSYTGYCGLYVDRYGFPPAGRKFLLSHAGTRAGGWFEWQPHRYESSDDYAQSRRNFNRGWFVAETERREDMWGVRGMWFVRRTVIVPYWSVALALGACPGIWLRRRARDRRFAERLSRGLCPSCGYDLRATAGRCPECGTAAAGKEA